MRHGGECSHARTIRARFSFLKKRNKRLLLLWLYHIGTRSFLAAASVTALTLLSGCMVGPDFRAPARNASQHYDRDAEHHLADYDAVSADQHISLGHSIAGDWWSAFQSPKLDGVMRRAVDGNLDLEAADATLAQANEAIAAARGGLFPQLDLASIDGRASALGTTQYVYAVGPTVNFDLDIFGGIKRQVEQKTALAGLQQHRFEAAYLTLTGDVASQALQLASARAQIDAVQVLLADDRKNLDLIETGHRYGSATQIDVALARTQLAQDETLLPPIAQQRDVARHALSVLASKGPADWVAPLFDLSDFALPPDLPVSLPSEISRLRPDILAAEAQLHAASAAIGVATADLYPRFQLSAIFAEPEPGIGILWDVAAGLTAPIFHGGTLRANRRGAIDGYKASLAVYRQTIIRSLGQVADILQSIHHNADAYAAQEFALSAAESSLRLNQAGYRAGEIDVLQVLDAERAYQRALLGEIRTRTDRYLDTVQLSIALGGNATAAHTQRTALNGARQISDASP
jgi:NodT family efflux transporter outer membrane factor (OMF) lipoprotein